MLQRSMTRLVAAGLSCGVILFASACGGGGVGSPEELGEAAVEALNDRDVQAYGDLICKEHKQAITEENFDFAKALPSSLEEATVIWRFLGVDNETDNEAKLKIEVKFENLSLEAHGVPDYPELEFPAVKEDGGWVLCE